MLKPSSSASRTRYYVVCFEKDLPAWKIFDGERLQPSSEPGPRESLPILILLPDHFFFFYLPDSTQRQGAGRQRLAAAKLQIEHMFPASNSGHGDSGVLTAGKERYLGFFRHPELRSFAERHKAVLGQANAVTTPFYLAWNTALSAEVEDWAWDGDGGKVRALASSQGLDYFQGSDDEWKKRLQRQTLTTVKHWSLNELLASAPRVGWAKLRLPMPELNGEGFDVGRLLRLGLVMAVLAILFCLGQGMRLADQKRQAAHWEHATDELYRQFLAPPLGPDPYGRLLFRLNQLKTPVAGGLDALELLGLLSSSAPSGFTVESVSLGANSGTIRAKLGDYDQLEALLQALEGHRHFEFTLDQATSADNEILVNLRVVY